MGQTGQVAIFKELRCQCHRLLARVSSTAACRLEVKCSRCARLAIYQTSTGA